MALSQITDLAARAAARVLSHYTSKPRFMALVNGVTGLAQDVETSLWAIVAQLDTATAQGAWLEYLGRFVGEGRAGALDAAYRLFIEARIIANRSQGTVEEIISVIDKVTDYDSNGLGTLLIRRLSPASLEVIIEYYDMDEPIRTRLMQLLRATRAAGVRLMVLYWPEENEDQLFHFSEDDTLQASIDLGFADDASAAGGQFIDADAP